MASQKQNPPQQEQPFVAAKQVGFNLEDIILNPKNKVARLYLEQNKKDHFKYVSDFISKCCHRKPFTKSPNMYKEYLIEFWYLAKALENSKVYCSTPTGGIYGEVGVNTFRNAIGAHYLPHSSEYVIPPSIDIVRPWFETIGKPFTKSPNMYKEYLTKFWYSAKALENSKVYFSTPTGGIYGEVGVNTFKNAIGAHFLPHSSEYVAPPSIDLVRPWFETIRYREAVPAKGTLKKSLLPLRWRLLMAQIIQRLGGKTEGFDQITNKDAIILYSLANGINIDYASIFWEDIIVKLNKKHREKAQKPNQPKEPSFTDHMLAFCAADTAVVFEAPKSSSNVERVPQGTKPGAKPGHKKHLTSLKQSSVSNKKATKGGSSKAPTSSKTGHSKKRKESSSAMESNSSQPPVSTPVDTGMHKEDQQETSGPISLGVTSEERANPHLSSGSRSMVFGC
nr:hypothetical protein [Tanacetum cinerariifolium]